MRHIIRKLFNKQVITKSYLDAIIKERRELRRENETLKQAIADKIQQVLSLTSFKQPDPRETALAIFVSKISFGEIPVSEMTNQDFNEAIAPYLETFSQNALTEDERKLVMGAMAARLLTETVLRPDAWKITKADLQNLQQIIKHHKGLGI